MLVSGPTVRGKVVDEVQVVSPEIQTPEWCTRGHRKAGWPTSGQGGIEIRCHCQGTGVCIIQTWDSDGGPDYVDCVGGLVFWVCCLAQQICWATTCDIYLGYVSKCLENRVYMGLGM